MSHQWTKNEVAKNAIKSALMGTVRDVKTKISDNEPRNSNPDPMVQGEGSPTKKKMTLIHGDSPFGENPLKFLQPALLGFVRANTGLGLPVVDEKGVFNFGNLCPEPHSDDEPVDIERSHRKRRASAIHKKIGGPRKSVVIYHQKDYESVVSPSKHRGSSTGIDEMDLKNMILQENAEDESLKKSNLHQEV